MSEVKAIFSRIAKRYDVTNAVLSSGLHKYWNKKLIDTVVNETEKGAVCLDLCCGTGAIGLGFLRVSKRKKREPKTVYFLDFCEEMLDIAKKSAPSQNRFFSPSRTVPQLHFMVADAKHVPLGEASCDAVTMAYGIRNIDSKPHAFSEMKRLLKPGGIAAILELTRPKSRPLRFLHRLWLTLALPPLGALMTGDKAAYKYLKNSIETFLEPEELMRLGESQGLEALECRPLCCGIATLFTFRRPL